MYYHLILTDDCNLCCTYCRGKAFGTIAQEDPELEIDDALPLELAYDLEDLYSFLETDPDPCLTFYGGEPLLRSDLVREIMDHAPADRFMLQTNAILLDALGPEYTNRFETILISLDGPPELTDLNRGQGTFARVMENIIRVTTDGYKGELIARMTVTEASSIYDAVTYLGNNAICPFNSIHWQLDADFSSDSGLRNFHTWLGESYNPGISRLVRDWLSVMATEGRVMRWYPFLGSMEDLLFGGKSRLRCGAGHANYTIMTDGNIGPCPVMIGMTRYYLGHIRSTKPADLSIVPVQGRCKQCGIRDFCGGRCLYSHITAPWPEDHKDAVCSSVHFLYQELLGIVPEVRMLIDQGCIRRSDFAHTRYNGCEIIP